MVICSRCHRNIPDSELAAHQLSHKSKRHPSRPPEPSRASKSDRAVPLIQAPQGLARSLEEFSRQRFARLPQKSSFSKTDVEREFQDVLKGMELKIKSLAVRIKRATTLAQVTFDAQRDVVLEYDDYFFQTLSRDEMRSVLSHEACHIATLPDTKSIVLQGSSSTLQFLQSTFIESYDEFLAHNEFRRRFAGTEIFTHYRNAKLREFEHYDTLRTMGKSELMDPAIALYSIVNDAVYFPVVGDNGFDEWSKARKVDGLTTFLDWLIEDFRQIESLKLNRIDTMSLATIEGFLSLGVNGIALLTDGSLQFVESAPEMENKAEKDDPRLAVAWRKRRVGV